MNIFRHTRSRAFCLLFVCVRIRESTPIVVASRRIVCILYRRCTDVRNRLVRTAETAAWRSTRHATAAFLVIVSKRNTTQHFTTIGKKGIRSARRKTTDSRRRPDDDDAEWGRPIRRAALTSGVAISKLQYLWNEPDVDTIYNIRSAYQFKKLKKVSYAL